MDIILTVKKGLLTFSIFSFSFLQGQSNLPKLYKKCLPAIVKISVQKHDGLSSEGTGFFIDEKTIVTCYHVVDNVNTIAIQDKNGKIYTVDSVIASNRASDLIKFSVKEKNNTWLKLSEKNPEPGENVFVIGNPDDYDFSISNGIVSAVRIKNSIQVIQNTAPASPGNSGSPLLNSKGFVVGVMSYVKYTGQNLNFAATSFDVAKIKNDNTIKYLTAVPAIISGWEMDSLLNLGNSYYKNKQYDKALDVIIPLTKFANTSQAMQLTELMADCYFYKQDYTHSVQYYDYLIKALYTIKEPGPQNLWTFANSLYKQSLGLFVLGDKDQALYHISKAAELCKNQLEIDKQRKDIYTWLIQQVYISDATYKFSLNRQFEACLSWKIAKQYGYNKDDLGYDVICK